MAYPMLSQTVLKACAANPTWSRWFTTSDRPGDRPGFLYYCCLWGVWKRKEFMKPQPFYGFLGLFLVRWIVQVKPFAIDLKGWLRTCASSGCVSRSEWSRVDVYKWLTFSALICIMIKRLDPECHLHCRLKFFRGPQKRGFFTSRNREDTPEEHQSQATSHLIQ